VGHSISYQFNNSQVSKKLFLRIAFNFIENYFVDLDVNQNEYVMVLQSKSKQGKVDKVGLDSFVEQVVFDESVREKLTQQKTQLREIIISKGLFPQNIVSQESFDEEAFFADDDEDYSTDPLGISVTWEEKFNKSE